MPDFLVPRVSTVSYTIFETVIKEKYSLHIFRLNFKVYSLLLHSMHYVRIKAKDAIVRAICGHVPKSKEVKLF
jgi:hypothetical protein